MKSELVNHLEKLKYFKIVAECESFYRASLKLGISQPALTRSIQSLESVLSFKVFDRSRRGIKLTFSGQKLLTLTKEIFLNIENWEASLSARDKNGRDINQLRLGTYENLATTVVPFFIKNIEDKFKSSLSLKIISGPSNSNLTLDLLEKKYDYIFLAEPQRQPGVSYQGVAKEHYGFYATKTYLESRGIKNLNLTPKELAQHRLLTIPRAIAGVNKTIDRILWELSASSEFEFNSFEIIKSFMLKDLGICLIPSLCVWEEIKNKQVKQLIVRGLPQGSIGKHNMYLCAKGDHDENQFLAVAETLRQTIVQIRDKTSLI